MSWHSKRNDQWVSEEPHRLLFASAITSFVLHPSQQSVSPLPICRSERSVVRYVFALTHHGRLQCVHIETGARCGDSGAWLGESPVPETSHMAIDSSGLYLATVANHPSPPPEVPRCELAVVEAGSGRVVARQTCLPEISCVSWNGERLLLGTSKGSLIELEVWNRDWGSWHEVGCRCQLQCMRMCKHWDR